MNDGTLTLHRRDETTAEGPEVYAGEWYFRESTKNVH